MNRDAINVLLADDDIDDCMLFQDALAELSIDTAFSTVNDGEQLMRRLADKGLPDLIFLDLNMPRKNGFECLTELMANEDTRNVPVVIFSTSFNPDVVKLLHSNGAHYYIRKPEAFESLKRVIEKVLRSVNELEKKVLFSEFVIHP